MKLWKLSLTLLPIFFQACGGDDGVAPSVLAGSWATTCLASPGGSSNSTLVHQALNRTYVTRFFSDASCATLEFEYNEQATFMVGELVPTPAGASKIDLTFGASTILLHTANTVNDANTQGWCGFTDWALNTAKDVTGLASCGNLSASFQAAGTVLYDIFQIQGSGRQLYQGYKPTAAVGTSDATRPTSLDNSIFWTLQ